MERELRDKWLAALRSGEYPQALGLLHSRDGFCCLGVLCQIADLPEWNGYALVMGDNNVSAYTIPYQIKDRLRISSKYTGPLINMNDKEGKTFPEIADWIEENM